MQSIPSACAQDAGPVLPAIDLQTSDTDRSVTDLSDTEELPLPSPINPSPSLDSNSIPLAPGERLVEGSIRTIDGTDGAASPNAVPQTQATDGTPCCDEVAYPGPRRFGPYY
ncbi:MAG: hypothetical protein SGJ20_02390, partial [Planctomycetota bacterium]|nr:hypothetical protein [Planctomycetota bacterium]